VIIIAEAETRFGLLTVNQNGDRFDIVVNGEIAPLKV
jgi:hypothetical protein